MVGDSNILRGIEILLEEADVDRDLRRLSDRDVAQLLVAFRDEAPPGAPHALLDNVVARLTRSERGAMQEESDHDEVASEVRER